MHSEQADWAIVEVASNIQSGDIKPGEARTKLIMAINCYIREQNPEFPIEQFWNGEAEFISS